MVMPHRISSKKSPPGFTLFPNSLQPSVYQPESYSGIEIYHKKGGIDSPLFSKRCSVTSHSRLYGCASTVQSFAADSAGVEKIEQAIVFLPLAVSAGNDYTKDVENSVYMQKGNEVTI
jgi:hypothetical protein